LGQIGVGTARGRRSGLSGVEDRATDEGIQDAFHDGVL
jgi:hypothetical protein